MAGLKRPLQQHETKPLYHILNINSNTHNDKIKLNLYCCLQENLLNMALECHDNSNTSSSEFKILTQKEKNTLSKQRKRARAKSKLNSSNKTKKLKREQKKKRGRKQKHKNENSPQLSESSTKTCESDEFQILTRNQQSASCNRKKRKRDKAKQKQVQDDRRRAHCESCAYQSLFIRLITKALRPTSTAQHFAKESTLQDWIEIYPFYRQILQEAGWKMISNRLDEIPILISNWGWDSDEYRGPKQKDESWYEELDDSDWFNGAVERFNSLEWTDTEDNRANVRKAFVKLKQKQHCNECTHHVFEAYEKLKLKNRTFYIWMVELQRCSNDYTEEEFDEEFERDVSNKLYQELI